MDFDPSDVELSRHEIEKLLNAQDSEDSINFSWNPIENSSNSNRKCVEFNINPLINLKEPPEVSIDAFETPKNLNHEFNDPDKSDDNFSKRKVNSSRHCYEFNIDSIRDMQEDRQRLELLLKLDSYSNQIQEKVNPLDLIHEKELQEATITDKIIKTSLKDKRQFQAIKLPVVIFNNIIPITQKLTSIASQCSPVCLSSSSSLLIIGLRSGQILIFRSCGQELRTLKVKKGFGHPTSLEITTDEAVLAAGYQFGQVALWEIKSGKCIRACNTLHSTAVLALKFWKGNFSNLISGETNGRAVLIEYGKAFLSTRINYSELLKNEVGSILGIERLAPDNIWPHSTDSGRVIAIAGPLKILVMNLKPEPKIIYTIDRPSDLNNNENPCISFKRAFGPGDIDPIDYVLAVGWGTRISLYRVQNVSDDGILPVGYFATQNEIKGISWLSNETLFILGKSREVRIISSRKMYKENLLHYEGKKTVLEEDYSNRDIASQAYVKADGGSVFTYFNTVRCYDRFIYILGNKDFQVGKLLNWKECIEELEKKNEWVDLLALGMDLYKGKGRKLHNLPKNKAEIRPVLENCIRTYVKTSSIAWMHKITHSIEFCIEIESPELLFSEFFDIFIDEDPSYMKHFINTLEPYILSREIRVIPTQVLGKMIGFYLNAGLPNILGRIILNIDPACIKPKYILPFCDDKSLLNTYIFISTNSPPKNFMNPINRLFELARASSGKTQKMYAYKLMWYFRLCIRGETFPYGFIEKELLNKVIADLARWTTEYEYSSFVLKCDCDTFLGVLLMMFEDKFSSVVIEKRLEGSPNHQELIDSLLTLKEPESYLYYQLMHFVLKLANLPRVQLTVETYMRTVKYMLASHEFAIPPPIYAANIEDYILSYTYRHDLDLLAEHRNSLERLDSQKATDRARVEYFGITEEEKGTILLGILKKCGRIKEAELKELFNLAESTNYEEVLVYLFELKGEFTNCISCFLKSNSQITRQKVFPWLYYITETLNDSGKLIIKNQVLEAFSELLDIDSKKSAQIVNDWFQSKHIEILTRLDSNPKAQIQYLKELTKDSQDEGLIFKYLVLLCCHEPNKVLDFLSSREDYNTEDCLRECLKHNIPDAASYLYEQLGRTQEALDILLKTTEKYKQKLLANLHSKEELPKESLKSIHYYTRKAIQICQRNTKRLDTSECEDYWFQVLKTILIFYNTFEEAFEINPKIELAIHMMIKEILEHMMASVDFNRVITFIIKNFEKIPFKYFKENIHQTFARQSYQKLVYRQAIHLLGKDIGNASTHAYNLLNKGSCSRTFCASCKLRMASTSPDEKYVLFNCGHSYHSYCVKNYSCKLCRTQNKKKHGVFSSQNSLKS